MAEALSSPLAGALTMASAGFAEPPPGFVIEERFLSGTATSYECAEAGSEDSLATSGATAGFRTRVVTLRPLDPARFNGTVLVEWLNVTGGTDAAPDWTYLHREIERGGYAYVAVSAQIAGIEGGPVSMPGLPPIKKADPERYKSLHHPGDAFSFDIFSQAGALVREAKSNGILGELQPHRLIAIGESQSAAFLVTYVNLVDPLAEVFDGFLIHSRFRGAAPLDGNYMASFQAVATGQVVEPVAIKADLRVPVLTFITETDLLSPGVGFIAARQADSAMLRTWEVAGTAHADTYTLAGGVIDTGNVSIAELALAFEPVASLFGQALPVPINAAPQHHYVLQAGLRSLVSWVESAASPPGASLIETTSGSQPTIVRDAMGNACGGIRSPWTDAPTAVLSGFGQPTGGLAALFGSTISFGTEQLANRYPNGRADYIGKFTSALDQAIAKGHILADDRTEILALATHSYPGK